TTEPPGPLSKKLLVIRFEKRVDLRRGILVGLSDVHLLGHGRGPEGLDDGVAELKRLWTVRSHVTDLKGVDVWLDQRVKLGLPGRFRRLLVRVGKRAPGDVVRGDDEIRTRSHPLQNWPRVVAKLGSLVE